jgi:hypothetical protein
MSALPKYTDHINSFNYRDHVAESNGSFTSNPLFYII